MEVNSDCYSLSFQALFISETRKLVAWQSKPSSLNGDSLGITALFISEKESRNYEAKIEESEKKACSLAKQTSSLKE